MFLSMTVWCFPLHNTTRKKVYVAVVESHISHMRIFPICWVMRLRIVNVWIRNCLRRMNCGISYTPYCRLRSLIIDKERKSAIWGRIIFSSTKMDRSKWHVSTRGLGNRLTTREHSMLKKSRICHLSKLRTINSVKCSKALTRNSLKHSPSDWPLSTQQHCHNPNHCTARTSSSTTKNLSNDWLNSEIMDTVNC